MAITWESPPVRKGKSPGRPKSWMMEAAELRSNPGEWGVVTVFPVTEWERASRMQSHIKRGILAAFPKGQFEASYARIGLVAKVFARYIGE